MERKSEWTSEGEQKRATGVWETEKTLREQMSAYDSMHERVMISPSRVAPQVIVPVPAVATVGTGFLFPDHLSRKKVNGAGRRKEERNE
ncbi:hypothetical protein SAMN02910292_01979 [Lachnospiraceae bacterium XBB2008]|nr:hypothetical protein SAMN02910292_01979 [Lachnospiraceae bacterium XBB2008]